MKINWSRYSQWQPRNVLVGFADHLMISMYDEDLSFEGLFPSRNECEEILMSCPARRNERVIPEYVEVVCWLKKTGIVSSSECYLVTYDRASKMYRIEDAEHAIIYQEADGKVEKASVYEDILKNCQRIPYSECGMLK